MACPGEIPAEKMGRGWAVRPPSPVEEQFFDFREGLAIMPDMGYYRVVVHDSFEIQVRT